MTAKTGLVFIVILVLLTACQPPAAEVVDLPTLAVLPSLTPSNTPTSTPTPTYTPTATPTFTPTATNTPLPTATFTPSITSTFTITPTFTVTPTATATPTFTPTATFTASPTPNTPQIIAFTASANNVAPNTSVMLSWQTVSDSARIDQLNQQGAVVQTFSVVPTGQLPVSVPGNQGRLVIYRLTALRGGQQATASVPITIQCSIGWFFGNEFAPPDAGCPTTVGAVGSGAFQAFERGFMVYVNANGLNTVYGLQTGGNMYISYPNGWDGTTAYTCASSPPAGLLAPQDMFAWLYCTTNAPIGGWSQAVGWATSAINKDPRTIQYEDGTGAFYIDSPLGVFRFSNPQTRTWTKIK